jgi:Fur family peroxide stress response transcriptional regulator
MRTKYFQKREQGTRLKRTPQRLAIVDFLEGNTTHPSADEIYQAVSKKHRSLSIATVYNTLHTLAKAGAVRELTIDPERTRYDPNTSHHHHLMCVLCGKIVDIPGGIAVDLPSEMAQQFTLLGNHIEFYGHCPSCKTTGDS